MMMLMKEYPESNYFVMPTAALTEYARQILCLAPSR
jgi:hypothetical protein